jgi:DNA-binding PadR family transcriptional regulator
MHAWLMQHAREVQLKLVKSLLELIVLRLLEGGDKHGYLLITEIRRNFGVYFGPSTVYPLLIELERDGYVRGQWMMNKCRPRKEYAITCAGKELILTYEQINQIILQSS